MNKILSVLVLVIALGIGTVVTATNIQTGSQYSQFIDTDLDHDSMNDLINWAPTGYGATVTDTTITGYIWGETVGWINLNPDQGGVTNTCDGELAGYAWGQNTGWINFAPTNATTAPNIDAATGIISGQVWSQNYGWIELSSAEGGFSGLTTEWSGCPVSGSTSGSALRVRTLPAPPPPLPLPLISESEEISLIPGITDKKLYSLRYDQASDDQSDNENNLSQNQNQKDETGLLEDWVTNELAQSSREKESQKYQYWYAAPWFLKKNPKKSKKIRWSNRLFWVLGLVGVIFLFISPSIWNIAVVVWFAGVISMVYYRKYGVSKTRS